MADNQLDREAPESDDESGTRKPKNVMSAKEALEMIRQGTVIENVRIERLVFRGEWEKPIRLKNCHLVKPRFDGPTFLGEVEFISCTLDRPHFSGTATFKGNWRLMNSTVINWQMGRVTVLGKFDFTSATTKGTVSIANCHFAGGIRLWEANFQNWINFKVCEFGGEIDMRSFVAQQGFVAAKCKFKSDVALRGASVAMKCDFSGSRFEGMLDFSRAKLNDYWYLEEIEAGEKFRLTFSNAVGDRLLIKPSQIEGRLQSEQQNDYLCAMKEYAFLKSCYADQHRYEDEDWAFHRFKVMQRRGVNRSWARPWTKVTQFLDWLFLDLGCGYCTNPYRAIRTACIVVLFFALVYALGVNAFHNLEPDKLPMPQDRPVLAADESLEVGKNWHVSWGNSLVVGLLTSVSLFTSGAQGIQNMAKGWMNLPIILEAMIGLLLWGLFIVSFSRKVIR